MSLSETKLSRDNADDGKDDAGRLQQYKNLTKHEELRRRRTECSVEIRKQKGADLMMKRRNIIDNEDDDLNECESENEDKDKLSNGNQMSNTNRLSNDEIKQILSSNPSEDDMIRCFESLRKSLSKTKNPPIDDVIQSGLINALVQALRVQNDRVQYEAAWALTNIVSGSTSQTMSAVEAGACAPLIELSCHSDGQIAEQALWAVANIAGDSAQLRDYVIECHGVEALMHIMSRIDQFTTSHVRTIAWALSNMCRHQNPHAPLPVLKVLAKGLAALVKHSDRQVRQDACWAVSYLTDGPDEQIELARESGVLSTIVSYLDESENLIAPALRTLGNVATGNDSLTQSVIDLGVLDRMVQLMEKTRSTSIMKECCWLISNIIAGTQKQIQAVLDAHLLPILVNILKSGDHKCQFEASWALSNLAQGGTSRQIVAMMEENVVPALCQALNTTHNQDMLNNTLETLYTLMLTVQTSYSHKMDILHDEVEENGGLDALERLQESQSESIYTQAYRIITQFFGDDENDENGQNDENSRASAAGMHKISGISKLRPL
ncbi:Protein CBR-IMA-2 [Caenorhabditis briggsae]|uniref:Importin subunit alpha n=1 Tax=Caenorhabditis briggsae TaxID=6238 RepID=A8XU42_CAEBR|nr:Protein CBR-IMA-2 [Caenorhabditis briggsae]CAP36167.1 Protein CBR-IMA-2 [Caenorhabditis briggsae]